MVKPTADRKREQLDWAITYCWFLDWNGCATIQSLMWPLAVVVLFNVFGEQTIQVPFIEHDDVIEQLTAKGADKPFNKRILPRTPRYGTDLFDAHRSHAVPKGPSIDPVPVA